MIKPFLNNRNLKGDLIKINIVEKSLPSGPEKQENSLTFGDHLEIGNSAKLFRRIE